MEKLKQHKEVVIITAVILGFIFYWFQLRPTTIRKNCSWLTQMEKGANAIPAFPGVTKEEANRKRSSCSDRATTEASLVLCEIGNTEVPPRPAVPAQPDKEVTREATKTEYDKCLRHNGL